MEHYNKARHRQIDTPVGDVEIREKKWNEGSSDEYWTYVQEVMTQFDDDTLNGEIVAHLLEQYSIVYHLVDEGYEFHEQLDESKLMWIKYD